MSITVTVLVLAATGVLFGRRGHWVTSAVCWLTIGVVIAGADSPIASLAQAGATAVIGAATAFFTALGKAL